jgi:transposase InsO family protein
VTDTASASSVERALRRRGLLQPIDYTGERRELAKAREAAFAEDPTAPNEVWQLDFSEYETTSGGVWRLAGVTDYFTKYEHGWHIAPTCTGADAIAAVQIAIAEAERLAGRPLREALPTDPDTGQIRRIKLVTDNGAAFKGAAFARFIASPAGAAAHPHPAQVARPERRPGTRLRQLEVRAPLPVRDRRPAHPGRRGRGLPADPQPHSST